MIRRTITLAALGAGPTLIARGAPGGAATAARCKPLAPAKAKLTRNKARTLATVSWRLPSRHPANLAYRVTRDGAVVGQTRGRRMRVRVSPGVAAKITVTAVVGGRPTGCHVTLRLRGRAQVRPGAPGAINGLFTEVRRGGRALRVSWNASARGARPLAGYRLLGDGKARRVTKRRSVTLQLRSRHAPPSRPAAVAASNATETTATLSWRPSRAVGARIGAYWILRKGRTVRAVKRARVRLTGLTSGQAYAYRIVAVDSLGWTSRRSQAVTVKTGHRPPGAPGAPSATSVTDTAVSLTWQPGMLPSGSKLRGYRVMRDGRVVSQVPATQASVGNLAPKSAHDWTVAAVDTRGYVSPPSPATRVVQADPPPTTGGVHAF